MTYILPLKNHLATLENVGGKGMSLSKLLFAEIPVPDGFHVTTAAYRLFVEANGIAPVISKLLASASPDNTAGLEEVSRQIAAAFAAGSMPGELKSAITGAYSILEGVPVAVRSSATAEDLPGASFAGQQETYLNIQGGDAVLAAVKRCWASLWTARAISYRMQNHIDQETVALAVVVQKLVFSDAAGVLFTANPVNGKRSELVINAAWGLGEAVVSGLVTPDTTVVEKATGKILSLEIADKQVMTVRTAGGTEETPVQESLRKKPALTEEQITELAKLGQRIEEYYDAPMDVEWALEREKLYIVQARPITVLPPEWKLPEEDVYYTKGSLAEHLPSPVSPLFATLGLEYVNQAAKVLWEQMFGNSVRKLWPEHGAYTIINGYVYFSCNYKPLLIMAKSLSPRSLGRTMRNSVPRFRAAQDKFAAVVDAWEGKNLKALTAGVLLHGVCELLTAASAYFTAIQLCLPSAMQSENLLNMFYKKTAARMGIADMSVFLRGLDTVALESEKSLYRIAMWVRENPDMNTYVESAPAQRIKEDFASPAAPGKVSPAVWEDWKREVMRHLEQFGRTCYEYDFVNPTPQEELIPTLEAMKSFVSGSGASPFDRQAEAVKKREEAEQAVLARVHGLRGKLFRKLLRWAQETAAMREDAIYHMGMGHPMIRRMLRELSCRLIAGGAIAEPDDIYWLKKQELEELIRGLDAGTPLTDRRDMIPPRKKELEQDRRFVSPNTLPERAASLTKNVKPVRKDGKLILTGIGTSAGVVTAPACILHGPADFERFQRGDVLVAVTTTPAWTPLFASAGAVVTDIGGPLSHSSIVAREYGIPAVMAAHAATRIIREGQMVTVDGGAGTVTLHE